MHGSSCIQVLNFTSDACCSASSASLCQRKSVSNRCLFCVISLTRRWKGNFAISNPVVLWYFLIYKIEHPVHGRLWPGHVAMMDAIFHLPECSSSYTSITPICEWDIRCAMHAMCVGIPKKNTLQLAPGRNRRPLLAPWLPAWCKCATGGAPAGVLSFLLFVNKTGRPRPTYMSVD